MIGRDTPSSSTPALSAVVVFGSQRGRAERCLEHLLAQTALERMEIVIIDLAAGATPVRGTEHSAVRWCPHPEFQRFGQARAEGLRQSRGLFVAFLEDHTYADA